MGGNELFLFCLLLIGLVILVFLPAGGNQFVNFDDPVYIYANAFVQQGYTPSSLHWAFTTFEGGFWHPLTWLSIMLDCSLFGVHAGGHHWMSVVLHAVNTALIFLVFYKMSSAFWRSAFVAVLFGLHPLHVESVAWASERKDVLSTLFFLLSLWAYGSFATEKQKSGKQKAEIPSIEAPKYYLLSLLCFTLGLMTKSMVVTLPVILLLLDWWPLERIRRDGWQAKISGLMREKIPFFALSLISGLITILAQKSVDALPSSSQFPIPARLANAVLSYATYLRQTILPFDLAVYYPYPKSFSPLVVGGVVMAMALATIAIIRVSPRRPYLAFGWLWYLVTLLPVIGLIQAGGQAHADRYTYVPLVGVFAAFAWAGFELSKALPYQRVVLSVISASVICVCALLTRKQISYWKDSETLFAHTIGVTKENETAHCNLGSALATEGRLDEAIVQFKEALRLLPNYGEARSNLGAALAKNGQVDEGLGYLQEAVSQVPRSAGARCNLADALALKGQFDDAIMQYREAIKLAPSDFVSRCNLGQALASRGRFDEAIGEYKQALRLFPDYVEARNRLGVALAMTGHLPEAVAHLREAARLRPEDAESQCNLGIALIQMNQLDEAMAHLEKAIRLRPEYAEAHCNLGVALGKQGRFKEAIPHLEEALRLRPDYVDALNNLRIAQAAKDAPSR